jgi:hypothetical protein
MVVVFLYLLEQGIGVTVGHFCEQCIIRVDPFFTTKSKSSKLRAFMTAYCIGTKLLAREKSSLGVLVNTTGTAIRKSCSTWGNSLSFVGGPRILGLSAPFPLRSR